MTTDQIWIGISILGQTLFSMRFIIQWLHSERKRKSVVPVAFWYFSLGGGFILFAYTLYRHEYVLAVGQASGVFVYLRNLYLIKRERRTASSQAVNE